MSERIVARAFRGTRRTSVYRDHAVDAAVLGRIAEASRRAGLAIAPSLTSVPRELELSELRRAAEVLDLDGDVTALAELARFCARARGDSWLTLVAA